MANISTPILLAALRVANDEKPKAIGATISVTGQHGDPARHVKIDGLIDLQRTVDILNNLIEKHGEP